MKIRILDAAKQDLIDGFQFYKRQSRQNPIKIVTRLAR